MPMDAQALRGGAESGMDRFCEQAFGSPESAKVGSQALLSAFNDSGLWLANLVQPQHLVAELRQQCSTLTRVVTTQWTHQGETLKMVRLAEALEAAQPPVLTHEAGQIMALLASLLGILRPAANQAPRWLQLSRPLLKDSVDPHLLAEAAKWVAVGQLLAPLPLEERLFWNRRLRDPLDDWEWESSEALAALRKLREILPAEHSALPAFQATLPPCWWQVWRESAAATTPRSTGSKTLPTFLLGLTTGIACMMLASWWVLYRLPLPEWVYFQSSQAEVAAAVLPPEADAPPPPAAAEPEPPVFDFRPVDEQPAASPAPVRPAPAVATVPPPAEPAPAAPLPVATIKRPTPTPVVETQAAPQPLSPAMKNRLAEAARLTHGMEGLERLHNLVKNGSLREATPLVQGRSSVAAQGSHQHRLLLRCLLLDPPRQAEVQALVSKTAVRTVPYEDLCNTLIQCLHSGSPNLAAAQECSELLLAISGDGLPEAERQKLTAAAQIK